MDDNGLPILQQPRFARFWSPIHLISIASHGGKILISVSGNSSWNILGSFASSCATDKFEAEIGMSSGCSNPETFMYNGLKHSSNEKLF